MMTALTLSVKSWFIFSPQATFLGLYPVAGLRTFTLNRAVAEDLKQQVESLAEDYSGIAEVLSGGCKRNLAEAAARAGAGLWPEPVGPSK